MNKQLTAFGTGSMQKRYHLDKHILEITQLVSLEHPFLSVKLLINIRGGYVGSIYLIQIMERQQSKGSSVSDSW